MAEQKKRITDWEETTEFGDNDYLMMEQYDSTEQKYDTKKIKASNVGGGGGTDEKVKQSPVSDSNNYRVILSDTDTDVEETADVNKSSKLSFNPQSGVLRVGRTSLESGENSTVGKIQLFRVEMGGTVKSMLIDPNSGIIGDSSNFDILLLSGTWDGTHDSLKDALANAGGGETRTTLYAPADPQQENTITLSDSVENYDYIEVYFCCYIAGKYQQQMRFDVDTIYDGVSTNLVFGVNIYDGSYDNKAYYRVDTNDPTSLLAITLTGSARIGKVVGVKR